MSHYLDGGGREPPLPIDENPLPARYEEPWIRIPMGSNASQEKPVALPVEEEVRQVLQRLPKEERVRVLVRLLARLTG